VLNRPIILYPVGSDRIDRRVRLIDTPVPCHLRPDRIASDAAGHTSMEGKTWPLPLHNNTHGTPRTKSEPSVRESAKDLARGGQ
jgi:hypothetical protein